MLLALLYVLVPCQRIHGSDFVPSWLNVFEDKMLVKDSTEMDERTGTKLSKYDVRRLYHPYI
jgi:hypothetical protein